MAWFFALLKIIGLVLSAMAEKNAEKKQMKKMALKNISKAIENKDVTSVTAEFDRINRL